MTIIHQPGELGKYLRQHTVKGNSVGFVPTMGALHPGHLALVKRSITDCDVTVCSIFVNPTQFNDPSDYNRYPVRLSDDIRLLAQAGADILFLPKVQDIYTHGTDHLETYDLGYLESVLEGRYRPGHFQGVCQVMSRLLAATHPNFLFMGQKDYQQCMVIERLLSLVKMDTRLIMHETLREKDGLAMSSRNLRLSPTERTKASRIFQSLNDVKRTIAPGELTALKKSAASFLENEGFRVDYFEIADARTLELTDNWNGSVPIVALVAAFLGEVRLIDNMLLNT